MPTTTAVNKYEDALRRMAREHKMRGASLHQIGILTGLTKDEVRDLVADAKTENDNAHIGSAILLVSDDEPEGRTLPVAIANTVNEARELASDHLHRLEKILESGGDPEICPYEYKLYTNGPEGYREICTFDVSEL